MPESGDQFFSADFWEADAAKKWEIICLYPFACSLSKSISTLFNMFLSGIFLFHLKLTVLAVCYFNFLLLNIMKDFLLVLLSCFIFFTMWYFLIQSSCNHFYFTGNRAVNAYFYLLGYQSQGVLNHNLLAIRLVRIF